jgi:DNA-binding transcriptional regulator YiaG
MNLIKALKSEISRLAKKEVKSAVTPLKAEVIKLKKANADLKKQLADLQRETKALSKATTNTAPNATEATSAIRKVDVKSKQYVTGTGIRSIRNRLKLTQRQLAVLVGVSVQTIIHWEKKPGKLTFRGNTLPSILEVKGLGLRDCQKRLEDLAEKKVKKPAKKPAAKTTKKTAKKKANKKA